MLNTFLEMHPLDQKVMIKQAISQLNPRMQHIAMRRFYQNQTLASIADELGVSKGRVWMIEAKLLRILKHGLNSGRM